MAAKGFNWKDIKHPTLIIAFWTFLFLILPGVAVIFFLDRALFESLDWVKLVLLAGSITVPLSFVNTMVIHSIEKGNKPVNPKYMFDDFSMGIWMSGFIVFLTLVACRFWPYGQYPWNISDVFLLSLLLLECMFVFVVFRDHKREKEIKNKSKKKKAMETKKEEVPENKLVI